jgi:hypothetical protein
VVVSSPVSSAQPSDLRLKEDSTSQSLTEQSGRFPPPPSGEDSVVCLDHVHNDFRLPAVQPCSSEVLIPCKAALDIFQSPVSYVTCRCIMFRTADYLLPLIQLIQTLKNFEIDIGVDGLVEGK